MSKPIKPLVYVMQFQHISLYNLWIIKKWTIGLLMPTLEMKLSVSWPRRESEGITFVPWRQAPLLCKEKWRGNSSMDPAQSYTSYQEKRNTDILSFLFHRACWLTLQCFLINKIWQVFNVSMLVAVHYTINFTTLSFLQHQLP